MVEYIKFTSDSGNRQSCKVVHTESGICSYCSTYSSYSRNRARARRLLVSLLKTNGYNTDF